MYIFIKYDIKYDIYKYIKIMILSKIQISAAAAAEF